MKLTVVGCSPAWPNPGGAQSGYLVEEDSRRLLLDCGPGVLARLRQLEESDWPRVDAVIVTHWHLDHWGDLVPWVWGNMVGPGQEHEQPELWLPPLGRTRLSDFGARLGWEDMFETSFKFRDYQDGVPFEAAGFQVTAVRVPHYTLRTYALRVSSGKQAVVYSGDSGPSDALVEVARGADLFVCEATLASGELDGNPRGHLSGDEAIAAFEASGAKRLLLTHRPHELEPPDGYELASDGLEVAL